MATASAAPKAAVAAAKAEPAAACSNDTWGALTFAGVFYIGAYSTLRPATKVIHRMLLPLFPCNTKNELTLVLHCRRCLCSHWRSSSVNCDLCGQLGRSAGSRAGGSGHLALCGTGSLPCLRCNQPAVPAQAVCQPSPAHVQLGVRLLVAGVFL